MTSDRESVEKRLHDKHAFTAGELTEERGKHAVTLEALRKSEAALAQHVDLLFAANREIDGLKRELAETHRATTRAQGALASVLRAFREAEGRPRVAPPAPSDEQIEKDWVERRGGR